MKVRASSRALVFAAGGVVSVLGPSAALGQCVPPSATLSVPATVQPGASFEGTLTISGGQEYGGSIRIDQLSSSGGSWFTITNVPASSPTAGVFPVSLSTASHCAGQAQFRAIVSLCNGTLGTPGATQTVTWPTREVLISLSGPVSVDPGASFRMSFASSGFGNFFSQSVSLERSTDEGKSWFQVTSQSISENGTFEFSADQTAGQCSGSTLFRVRYTNGCGDVRYSNVRRVSWGTGAPTLSLGGPATVDPGQGYRLDISASGLVNSLSTSWALEYSDNDGTTWSQWTSGSLSSNGTFQINSDLNARQCATARRHRLRYTDGCGASLLSPEFVVSSATRVPTATMISPASVEPGAAYRPSFTVEGMGTSFSTGYSLEYSDNNGKSWSVWTSGSISGDGTFQVPSDLTASQCGRTRLHRIRFSDGCGQPLLSSIASTSWATRVPSVALTVPASFEPGATYRPSFVASGFGTSFSSGYTIETSSDNGQSWTSQTSGSISGNGTFQATTDLNIPQCGGSRLHRVRFNDGCGASLFSNVVASTWATRVPSLSLTGPTTVAPGGTYRPSVIASGMGNWSTSVSLEYTDDGGANWVSPGLSASFSGNGTFQMSTSQSITSCATQRFHRIRTTSPCGTTRFVYFPAYFVSWPGAEPVSVSGAPASTAVIAGQTLTLTAPAVSGAVTGWRWSRDGRALFDATTPQGAVIAGSGTPTLTISNVRPENAGEYRVFAMNACRGGAWSGPATVTVGTPPACYPNCDNSSSPPILNALDFSCFLNRFRVGDEYANCDSSTNPPVLNALDFSCFLIRFQAGCN